MRISLLTFFLIGSLATNYSQDRYSNALVSLDKELEFKPTSDSYSKDKKPNARFVDRFKECAERKQLRKLTELNFDSIISVKSSELFTSIWEGKWQIEFKEWEFENENYASEFIGVLDSLSQTRIQFCVSKGGIMWWKDKSKIYIVTSRAYFVTYHYPKIKEAIIDGLKK